MMKGTIGVFVGFFVPVILFVFIAGVAVLFERYSIPRGHFFIGFVISLAAMVVFVIAVAIVKGPSQ